MIGLFPGQTIGQDYGLRAGLAEVDSQGRCAGLVADRAPLPRLALSGLVSWVDFSNGACWPDAASVNRLRDLISPFAISSSSFNGASTVNRGRHLCNGITLGTTIVMNNQPIPLLQNAVTVCYWVKFNVVPTSDAYPNRRFGIWRGASGVSNFNTWHGSTVVSIDYTYLTNVFQENRFAYVPDLKWHYFCGQLDWVNRQANFYIDGQPLRKVSGSVPGPVTTGLNTQYTWARNPNLNEFHNGALGAIHIYDRALTPAEIMGNYMAGRSRFQI